jgi:hypothetical protein
LPVASCGELRRAVACFAPFPSPCHPFTLSSMPPTLAQHWPPCASLENSPKNAAQIPTLCATLENSLKNAGPLAQHWRIRPKTQFASASPPCDTHVQSHPAPRRATPAGRSSCVQIRRATKTAKMSNYVAYVARPTPTSDEASRGGIGINVPPPAGGHCNMHPRPTISTPP